MKFFLLLTIASILTINMSAQKITKVEITTSTNVDSVLHECKAAGKACKYGSREFDIEAGTLVLWKNYGNKGQELIVKVKAWVQDGKTIVSLILPHVPNNLDSYPRYLKSIVKALKLSDMTIGQYISEIE